MHMSKMGPEESVKGLFLGEWEEEKKEGGEERGERKGKVKKGGSKKKKGLRFRFCMSNEP